MSARRWLLGAVRAVLMLAGAGLAAATLLPFSAADAWWARYPVFPAIQVAVAILLVVVLLAILWRHWAAWLGIAVLLACAAIQAIRLAPFVAPLVIAWPGPTVDASTNCAPQHRLRVLEVNVQRSNRHGHALLDMVRDNDPDVVWFQEVNEWWEGELSPLRQTMPFELSDVQDNYFGVHLYSKLPLSDASIQQLTGSNNPSIFATATLPSGRAVRLYGIHPRPPQIGQSTAERDAQLAATALVAHDEAEAHLVMGDLNAVPWDKEIARLLDVGRLNDPRRGRGLFVTWNAKRTLAKWPLDHVLVSRGIELHDLRVMPPFGSDHLPLLADLCVVGQAGSPAPLPAGTRDAALATVARGQGKADQPGAARPTGSSVDEKED